MSNSLVNDQLISLLMGFFFNVLLFVVESESWKSGLRPLDKGGVIWAAL